MKKDTLPPLERRYQRGILFKIEKCGLPASFILGTVHSASPAIQRAAADAFVKLGEVQTAGFEIAQGQEEIAIAAGPYMIMPQGTVPDLQKHLGIKRYRRLIELFKNARFAERPAILAHIRPWAIAVMLETIDEEKGIVLDENIKHAAIHMGKPVFGLETPREQLDIFAHMPEPLQWRMLTRAIDEHVKVLRLVHEMHRAYERHDARKLASLEEKTLEASEEPELDRYLEKHVLTDRNQLMEKRLLPRLKESVLLSIGALHLMGHEGILHLLEQDGYTVTPLP